MIEAYVEALIARLKGRTSFRAWAVEAFPDKVERIKTANPRTLFVSYEGSADTDAGQCVTNRAVTWAVTLIVAGQYGKEGGLQSIDAVRAALTGWTPPQGGDPLMPIKDGFVDEDQGKWRFVVTFKSALPFVVDPEAGNDPPAPYAPSGRREDGTFDLDTFLQEDVVSDPSPVDPTLLNPSGDDT